MQKNILKNNKGITLVSLIVTIVILVILVSIGVASLTGDSSIITHAQNAKNATEIGEQDATSKVDNILAYANNLGVNSGAHTHKYTLTSEVTATCTVPGKKVYKCDICGATKEEEIKAEHSYVGEETIEATCGSQGEITYTCSVCGDSYREATIARVHNYLSDITIEATCDTDGEITYTCQICGDSYTEVIIARGHNFVVDSTTGKETCTACGISNVKKLVEVAKIGDIVNYDPTTGGNVNSTNTTYTSVAGSTTNHGNGYDSQTFSATAYKNSGGKWRILNVEGETITLISDPIYRDNTDSSAMLSAGDENGLFLQDGIGYLWAEEELHRIGAIYGHGEGADLSQTVTYYYGGPNDQDGSITAGTVEAQQGRKTTLSLATPSGARALTVEDVNKICRRETTYTVNFSKKTETKNSYNAKYYPTLNTTNTTTGKSTEQTEFSGSYYYTDYDYTISSANTDTTAQTNQNTMLRARVNYWLGSRGVQTDSSSAFFIVRYVMSSGSVSYSFTCDCYSGSWYSNIPSTSYPRAVRAVVTLKSEIQTSDATYNESTGWNLT